MPDSTQNGHHDAPPPAPVVRPPLGERAARGVAALEPEETLPPSETEMAEPEVAAPEEEPAFAEPLSEEELAALAPFADNGGTVPPAPPLGVNAGAGGSSGDPNTPHDRELGLLEHLTELRTRLLWCFAAVGLAMLVTWNRCLEIESWITAPVKTALAAKKGIIISNDPTGFFTIYLQISMVSALILTMPFLLFQVWRFIEPALTNNERRYTLVLVPFASVLFFMGVGLGYGMSPMFFSFLLAFQPKDVFANWDLGRVTVFFAQILLIFGLAFQVPVVTIFLNKTGIVSRNILIHYWRHVVVVIFTVVAFVVPTWDPVTMTACAIPPCLLYLLSIWLVKWL